MSTPLLKRLWQSFQRTRLGRSIFRVGLPESNLERSQAMVSSFFLHFQPAKVHRQALRAGYSFGLGLISLYLFLILSVTGILLMFYYVPSTERAYNVMKDLQFVISAGLVLRNMHRWAAHLMVIFVLLHLCRVFYTGAYKRPREFNWMLGVGLFLLTLGLSFTGYLLPWDQLAFWAITVGTNVAGYAPVIGPKLQYVLLGGNVVGQEALTRFYALHVIVLPGVAGLMIAVHLWRVRKDGGLSRPGEAGEVVEQMELSQVPTNKSYGLMERKCSPGRTSFSANFFCFCWSWRWCCSWRSSGTRRSRNLPTRSIPPIRPRPPGISWACRSWSVTRRSGAAWWCRACWWPC
ncbi:MAG: cytochrome b N-terminal domain-containing protein [Verrucomicrobia bacterium]|nr:cytochrome b N-terminal domain-containing protein [Verrucomicrobiota bacterium]